MKADPTFHFYCNNDGRDRGSNEFFLTIKQFFPSSYFTCFSRTFYPNSQNHFALVNNNIMYHNTVLLISVHMFSLVFSFQWKIALNSFIKRMYVSEMANNFPHQKKDLALPKTHQWEHTAPPDHLTSDKISSDSFIKK